MSQVRARTAGGKGRATGRRAAVSGGAAGNGDGRVAWLTVRGAAHNNLKNIDVSFPLGRFICVTGVSGSGKSSLVNDVLYAALARELNRSTTAHPGRHAGLEGLEHLDKVIAIDQSPIGRTPRSNPATYVKVFDEIRAVFARLPDARLRGYRPGRFSFNVSARRGGGRCEACEGNGANRIEMDFLADVWVRCPVCDGQRFNRQTLQIRYRGRSIADVLEMDVQAALIHFENLPRIRRMLQTLADVGLNYVKLGQPSPTLSGGEAQRIKLARELVKKPTGQTLYVLDEPTTGLHFDDIRKLLAVLHGFVDAGNTVIVIEHNLDVIKTADWVIDLGPEGGEEGGRIVVAGTPEEVAECEASYTGRALREVLPLGSEWRVSSSELARDASAEPEEQRDRQLAADHSALDRVTVFGARQHNLKDLTVCFPREQITVCTGVSGSGKTSFAIDTVFAEGYRRYVESLSAYARQFLGQLAKPRVERVEGLSPAICIEQKAASRNPRSTVGTITEIYDYMRVLWARVGTPYCPRCQVPIGSQTVDEIVERVMSLEPGAPIMILAPVSLGDGETYGKLFGRLRNSGYLRVRIDGQVQLIAQAATLDARRKHRVEVVVDRTIVRPRLRGRIAESVEHALALGNGVMSLVAEAVEKVEEHSSSGGAPDASGGSRAPHLREGFGLSTAAADVASAERAATRTAATEGSLGQSPDEGSGVASAVSQAAQAEPAVRVLPQREFMFSQKLACVRCGTSYEELGPHHFGFNSQLGWCETCEGLGVQRGAPPDTIIRYPSRSLLDGAIAGWSHVDARSKFGRLLSALCSHVGVSPNAPLRDWTPEQKHLLMFGSARPTGTSAATAPRGEGIRTPHASEGQRVRTPHASEGQWVRTPHASEGQWLDGGAAFPGLRFQWRGFFPAIDAATRNSWSLRHRLHNAVTDIPCVACHGGRLRPDAAAVRVGGRTIVEVCKLPLRDAAQFFDKLKLDVRRRQIAGEVLKDIRSRLQFLLDVGLDYLTLHRAAPTLSGGEAQRIRLASQIGSGLSGVLYVLDEPTIGLHPRDNLRLINALRKLRNLGNTILMVEHDREVVRQADRLLDFGPRAGAAGGQIVAQGTPTDFLAAASAGAGADQAEPASLTRAYLSGELAIPIPSNRRAIDLSAALLRQAGARAVAGNRRRARSGWLVVRGCRQNNLKNIDVPIPLGRLVCVTGVSGSGKSSLVSDILWPALARKLHRATLSPGDYDRLDGADQLDKVINVDQSPIGSTPSSNPATYTGVFDWIRELFARLPESKLRGYTANRFSFNRPGGRCEACEGYGQRCIEMHFMPDVWVECETCRGRRYNPETLEVRFKGKSIADVLDMRVSEALALFANVPKVRRVLQTLADVGLDYVQLGQPAPTLSGGEAQRVKLAAELGKPDTGRTFYILDEPTTGLHFDDIRKLLAVIHRLADLGNTVLVVEHNLDVIKCADWVIDLGPEAGDDGGYIVTLGTPEELVNGQAARRAAQLHARHSTRSHVRRFRRSNHPADETSAAALATEGLARTEPPTPVGGRSAPARSRPLTCVRGSDAHMSHTAAALEPILAAGPYEPRTPYDPAAHAARELEVAKAGLGDVGRQMRMPWQVDGRRWHLSQRTARDGRPRRWAPAALEHVIDLVQRTGAFEPTNWNNRASVEITAPGAGKWFMHALTGGEWLLELYFRVPPGTFKWRDLDASLRLKTLDERDDLPIYGDWSRVDVRKRADGLDAVAIYVHDRPEIDTPAFRRFVRAAARAYLRSQGVEATGRRRGAVGAGHGRQGAVT